MNMAATLFRLTPEEALAGVTRNAARALGLADEASPSGTSNDRRSSPTAWASTRSTRGSGAAGIRKGRLADGKYPGFAMG
jgi:hypothetical protein